MKCGQDLEDDGGETPELKQARDLISTDFERHAVWVGVHNIDFGKPWYDRCDEATFRPWSETLPVSAKIGVVLVPASFELRDGGTYSGYIRAVSEDWDVPPAPRRSREGRLIQQQSFSVRHGGPTAILGLQQPKIFVKGQRFSFWGGLKGIPPERRHAFYEAISKAPDAVFPVRFSAKPHFATGILTGEIEGFYHAFLGGKPPEVEL
jgi:hypothetical protein